MDEDPVADDSRQYEAGFGERDAIAWLTEAEAEPAPATPAPRTAPTEAALAALQVVPPLLEAIPALLDALVRTTASQAPRSSFGPGEAEGWTGSESGLAYARESDVPRQVWEYVEPGWDVGSSPEVGFIALAGVLIPAAELGLGVFDRLQQHVFNGDFSVTATPASYIHSPSPTGLAIQKRTFRFPVTAHHPRYFIDSQTFWFDVVLEYDGFNVRRVSVTEDRGRSSSLHASDFTITFTPSAYTAANEPVSAIVYSIAGRWDPVGRGDESFSGRFVVDAAGNLTGLQVSSSQKWVRHGALTQSGGGPVPRPTTSSHITTVHFDPEGSYALPQQKIRHIHDWYMGLPTAVQTEIRKGNQPIRLTGRASTTGTVQQNQDLARKRANAVGKILRDLAGAAARLDIEVYGELGARTPDSKEDPDERRVDLECRFEVYQM